MVSFFKRSKRDLPDYWERYSAKFNRKVDNEGPTVFVVLDTETTGFDYETDRVLCIGAVKIIDKEISISNSMEMYVEQEHFSALTVPIHGIIQSDDLVRCTEEEAIEKFLDYIGNAVLVAHHAVFDMTMIQGMMFRHGLPELKNKVIDTVDLFRATRLRTDLIEKDRTYSLDELAERFDVDLSDRHTAIGDALITALVFLRTVSLLGPGYKGPHHDSLSK